MHPRIPRLERRQFIYKAKAWERKGLLLVPRITVPRAASTGEIFGCTRRAILYDAKGSLTSKNCVVVDIEARGRKPLWMYVDAEGVYYQGREDLERDLGEFGERLFEETRLLLPEARINRDPSEREAHAWLEEFYMLNGFLAVDIAGMSRADAMSTIEAHAKNYKITDDEVILPEVGRQTSLPFLFRVRK